MALPQQIVEAIRDAETALASRMDKENEIEDELLKVDKGTERHELLMKRLAKAQQATEDTREHLKHMQRATWAAVKPAGPPSASTVDAVIVTFEEEGKKKSKVSASFLRPPTFDDLRKELELKLSKFAHESYEMQCAGIVLTESTWQTFVEAGLEGLNIVVTSTRKSFTDITKEEALEALGIKSDYLDNYEFDEKARIFDLDAPLPDVIKQITTWQTRKDALDHLANAIAAHAYASNPSEYSKEAKLREYICPVLTIAAVLAGVDIHAERLVSGHRVFGYVDWVVVYKDFFIVVIEAKYGYDLGDYKAQLMGEIAGSREDFVKRITGAKRKRAHQEEVEVLLADVPTWGIITNGQCYRFYEYTAAGGEKRILSYGELQMSLHKSKTSTAIKEEVKPILGVLLHILAQQISAVDAFAKRQRTDKHDSTC